MAERPPKVHLKAPEYLACVSSVAAHRVYTLDHAQVTCPNCLKKLARMLLEKPGEPRIKRSPRLPREGV